MNIFSKMNEEDENEFSDKMIQIIFLLNDICTIIERQKNEKLKGSKTCH